MKFRLALSLMLVLAPAAVSQGHEQAIPTLRQDKPIVRTVTGNFKDRYRLPGIPAGRFIQIKAEQNGVDVTLKLLDKRGIVLAAVDSPNADRGSEILSFLAPRSGTMTLEVEHLGDTASGKYTLSLVTRAADPPRDQTQIASERALAEALAVKDTAVSDQKLETALTGWQSLGDRYRAALTLRQMALNAFSAGRKAESVELWKRSIAVFAENGNFEEEIEDQVNLARIYQSLQQFDQSREAYKQALALCLSHGVGEWRAYTLNLIGLALQGFGELDSAAAAFDRALSMAREHSMSELLAMVLHNLGALYNSRGDNRKAIEYLTESLQFGSSDHSVTLSKLGDAYADMADTEKALDHYQRALKLQRSAGDRDGEATTLANIGLAYRDHDDYPHALQNLLDALRIREELKDVRGQAADLREIADVYDRQGDKAHASDAQTRALDLLRQVGDRAGEADALYIVATDQFAKGQNEQALDSLSQVLNIRRSLKDQQGEGKALRRIGDVYSFIGDRHKALTFYEQYLEVSRELKNRWGEAYALRQIADYFGTNRQDRALQFYEKALAIHRSLGDRSGEAATLIGIADLLVFSSRRNEALEDIEKALSIYRQIGDASGEATALTSRAAYRSDIYAALEDLQLALAKYRQIGDEVGIAGTLSGLADNYRSLGEYGKASELYEKTLSAYQKNGYTYGIADTQNRLGLALDGMGDHSRALASYDRSLKAFRELGLRSDEAYVLNNIAATRSKTGDKKAALDTYFQALAITRSIGDRELEGTTSANIGVNYYQLKQYKEALDFLSKGLAINRFVGDRRGEARTSHWLMQLWRVQGVPALAILYGKQAVNTYQTLRSELKKLDKSSQASFKGVVSETYRDLADVLISRGRISEAEQVLSMLKEEEAFTFLTRDDGVAKGMLQTLKLDERETAALKRYNEIADSLTTIGKDFGELEAERKKYTGEAFPDQGRYDELRSKLADAQLAFQKFLDELKVTFGQKDERVVQVDSSLQATLKRLKAKRTAVVSTIIGEDKLNVIVTTANTQRAHTAPIAATEINRIVADLRHGLTDPHLDPRPSAQKLYDILVKPIEGDLKGIDADTILWSLDGTLRYIPVAALWDKDKGYMAERFANVVLTLASRETIALPVTEKDGWRALGVGVSKAIEGFNPLTSVPDELDCIITDDQNKTVSAEPKCPAGVVSGRKLLDDKFTAGSFESAVGNYPLVHIASHFSLNPGSEKDSFLLLGGGENKKFTVEDLRGVSLTDVELLVLSACNTATPGGEKANGVEIEGFGAVAQKQGAKAVMASLWPVADVSTKDLMVEFYRLYGTEKQTKAAALRTAQLRLLRGGYPANSSTVSRGIPFASQDSSLPPFKVDPKAPFAHPYYWSPFILIGNWR